ncbi:flagellar basal-body rod protein FlgB [Evansella caseinilytica]|uniref:Flagellar basal body rod protein FlgB n=1 Tax=Evansella caseinilytica TaxID=1503961 RepID=A0A1H3M6X7_9BACI|nr:flagellar basal body rod protein FlgB [Evansella caseinilytica]SDY72343.1 flagellar basal-body rod protein FlgB [Evansella caseinilytica]
MDLINNATNQLLQTALTASTTRQNTISQNIANVDTPNYKAKKAVFAHELSSAIDRQKLTAYRTDVRHIPFGGSSSEEVRVIERTDTQYNHNGNNVDIDLEMADMAKNQIYYNALTDRLNGRFNSVLTVLGKGG